MNRTFKLVAALLAAATAALAPSIGSTAPGTGKWVTAYYGSYFWDVPDYQRPEHVDMTAMTHFVFARIGPGGGRMGGEPGTILPGGGTAQTDRSQGPGAPANQTVEEYMVARAHAAGVKALIMLGGAGDEEGFRASTAAAVRTQFVNRLVEYLVQKDYDGIDLDWEGVTSAADQAALEALARELRSAANSHPRYQDSPVIITYPAGMLNMNIDQVSEHSVRLAGLVDQFNVMSYGAGWFGSGWESTVSAPLTGYSPARPMDIASTVQAYVDAGIPREKIGMGIGFYGISYRPPFSGPGMSTEGYDLSYWDTNDVRWNYAMLHKYGYLSQGNYVWDSATQTGYRSYPGGYEAPGRNAVGYVSYEDARSITAKGAWARSTAPGQGVGGTIVWLLNYGTTDGQNNPLMAAVKRAFLDENAPEPDPVPPPAADIRTSVRTDSDWGSGYCATVDIVNHGNLAAVWHVAVPFADTLTSLWNAIYAIDDGKLSLQGQEWNRYVYPGQTRSVGFCASRLAAPPPPAPAPGAVTVAVTIDTDWGNGYCAKAVVTNSGAATATNWSASTEVQGQVSSLWNASYVQEQARLTLSGAAWSRDLPAGAQLTDIGFCANR
jgi:GH18 family chitinase